MSLSSIAALRLVVSRMRAPVRVGPALLLIAISGCAAPTETVDTPLVGRWQRSEAVQPAGRFQHTLTFTRDGGVVVEVRNFGLYPTQVAADLSAFTREEGTFRVRGDTVVLAVTRRTWWDRFYGATSPEHVERVAAAVDGMPPTRFVVRGDSLTLRYTSYPADAPVPTEMSYARVP